ncbi:MAG TPA: NDMA-dependent alcohol dehydrogenase [Acidimicrobiales bacterium]|nr:NDMA-dependent alcohol dehydrogenase [Acidimicrobiales bacterium]
MQVKATVVSELHGPWRTELIEIDEPHAGEVKVKMAFAGMCHSDEHLRTGDIAQDPAVLELISGRDTMFPIIGGHEGSGVVEAVGEGVTDVKVGDHVALSFVPSCGKCQFCASGRQYLCDLGATTLAGPMISDGTWRHHLGDVNLNRMTQLGTFSEYVVVHESSIVRIEPWYDLRAAALISCGISTGFGSAVNRGGVKPGDTVAVIGCGGVGAGAIQGARFAGARGIVAIDTNPTKVERAMKIGATHGCATTLDAAFTILPELTMGRNCDVTIITVGVLTGELIEQARSITAKGGVIVVTSIAPFSQRNVELDLFMLAMYNQELRGTIFGSESPRVQIPRLLRLHHEGSLIIDDLITNEYSLDEVHKGYEDLESGINLRGVVRF